MGSIESYKKFIEENLNPSEIDELVKSFDRESIVDEPSDTTNNVVVTKPFYGIDYYTIGDKISERFHTISNNEDYLVMDEVGIKKLLGDLFSAIESSVYSFTVGDVMVLDNDLSDTMVAYTHNNEWTLEWHEISEYVEILG